MEVFVFVKKSTAEGGSVLKPHSGPWLFEQWKYPEKSSSKASPGYYECKNKYKAIK